jgi:hypothetical protein
MGSNPSKDSEEQENPADKKIDEEMEAIKINEELEAIKTKKKEDIAKQIALYYLPEHLKKRRDRKEKHYKLDKTIRLLKEKLQVIDETRDKEKEKQLLQDKIALENKDSLCLEINRKTQLVCGKIAKRVLVPGTSEFRPLCNNHRRTINGDLDKAERHREIESTKKRRFSEIDQDNDTDDDDGDEEMMQRIKTLRYPKTPLTSPTALNAV